MAPSYSKPSVGCTGKKQVVDTVSLLSCWLVLKKTELVKGGYIIIKCRKNPSDTALPNYDLPLTYFITGTPEEFLNWIVN